LKKPKIPKVQIDDYQDKIEEEEAQSDEQSDGIKQVQSELMLAEVQQEVKEEIKNQPEAST
jgi:hypothetical protein